MKLIDVYNVDSLYSKLSNRTDLSVRTTYKILKFFKSLEEDVEFYKNELSKILEEYSEKDDNGAPVFLDNGTKIKIKEGKIEECEQKLTELGEIEAKTPDVFFDLDEIPEGLSVQEFNLLMPFIRE